MASTAETVYSDLTVDRANKVTRHRDSLDTVA